MVNRNRRRVLQAGLGGALTLAGRRALAGVPERAATPVLYVSHGAPIFVVNDPARIAELRAWGARLARPSGIVVMTPHFASRTPLLGATGRGFAMYDLPREAKRHIPKNLDYVTPPSGARADAVEALLGSSSGPKVGRAQDRPGFDHTTWMPLLCLFPAADVPVLEVAYPYVREDALFEFGRKLAPLREHGILVVASGGMTHNLASADGDAIAAVPLWSSDFDAWAAEQVSRRDVDALVDWRQKAPAAALAHPDDGAHYRVLLFALGVALGGRRAATAVSFPITGFESTLSRRSIEMG